MLLQPVKRSLGWEYMGRWALSACQVTQDCCFIAISSSSIIAFTGDISTICSAIIDGLLPHLPPSSSTATISAIVLLNNLGWLPPLHLTPNPFTSSPTIPSQPHQILHRLGNDGGDFRHPAAAPR